MTTPSQTILAIIPARAGSKRLKNKNMLKLGDIPLIEWSINAAKQSENVTKLVVNSDDLQIKDLCKKINVEFIQRPAELAQDTSSSLDVILHTISYMKKKGQFFENILLLQPTSPFRTHHHIDEAYEALISKKADGIISLRESSDHPNWSKNLNPDLDMSNFISKNNLNKRKQDLPISYTLNGAIYLIKTSELLKQKQIFLTTNIYGYLMNSQDSIDIDTKLDFDFAEFILKNRTKVKKTTFL